MCAFVPTQVVLVSEGTRRDGRRRSVGGGVVQRCARTSDDGVTRSMGADDEERARGVCVV